MQVAPEVAFETPCSGAVLAVGVALRDYIVAGMKQMLFLITFKHLRVHG
jgi:hypothetical protein